ncbi:hypothetical protein Pme01_53520 [Planosporangium mesophilum]|uniref:Uncharacterized protein n=1 Tax=Planosporangium mesophilum TaxID=689768 RepID=A0A8J3TR07_9ACTN|nr:hypothetical protein Pme01_53520 [Planosporangium mesophilum]
MKLTHKAITVGAVVAALLGSGTTAATAQTTPPPPPGTRASASPMSFTETKRRIDQHLAKTISGATTARQRVSASSTLTPAEKATLDADLNKLITDATTARRQVDAATNQAGLQAAQPALQAVKADHQKLHKDLMAVRSAHPTLRPTAPPTS